MQSQTPITLSQLFNLTTTCEVPKESIGFGSVSLESDQNICVLETAQGQRSVVIIDINSPNSPVRRRIKADSVMMHPSKRILALRTQKQIQIYNLDAKARIKTCDMTEDIVYWKWVNDTILALITPTSVYHWTISDQTTPPTLHFARHLSLNATKIINYCSGPFLNWSLLIGVTRGANDQIVGSMQLYSAEKKMSQLFPGHTAGFIDITLPNGTVPTALFCLAVRESPTKATLRIVEIGAEKKSPQEPRYEKNIVDIYFPPEAAHDFPVSMQLSKEKGILWLFTTQGYAHLYDIISGEMLYTTRISDHTIFASCLDSKSGGALIVNTNGDVLKTSMNETNIVQFISTVLKKPQFAATFAARNNLAGADDLFKAQFTQYFQQGKYAEAATVAAKSPNGILRTADTIRLFQQARPVQGQQVPILQYFKILMEMGSLNKEESIELIRPVIQQGRKELLKNWLTEKKLTCSEELGDLVRTADVTLGLAIYLRAGCKPKAVECFAELGQYTKIISFAKTYNYSPDYKSLLDRMFTHKPAEILNFATLLAANKLVDTNVIVEKFLQHRMLKEVSAFLLDTLNNKDESEGPLQTRLLEINLLTNPPFAKQLLQRKLFSFYDRKIIAARCETAGLYEQALEHYTDIEKIKECIVHTQHLSAEFVREYFQTMTDEYKLECLNVLLTKNLRQNLQICVQVAQDNYKELGIDALVKLFGETYKSSEGVFFFLGGILGSVKDPDVHFKYIESAVSIGHMKEVERVCRESQFYDPEKVKNFLMESHLESPIPLMITCNRYPEYIPEMVKYLYKNKKLQHIEIYCQRFNALKTPEVVGALLDVGCPETFIKNLISQVGNLAPVQPMVEVLEAKSNLKLLRPWLETLVEEGKTDAPLHNALAKIYCELNINPEQFLKENKYYESKIVGAYCAKRSPKLAVIAFERGQCDKELIEVTNESGLFKDQCRYLLARSDPELWAFVLQDENKFRRQLIDQTLSTGLPQCKDANQVSICVRAFHKAKLQSELLEILEKLVFDNSEFANEASLQNLLLISSFNVAVDNPEQRPRCLNYIERLDDFEWEKVSNAAMTRKLYEEAFQIFKKSKINDKAIKVLVENIDDLKRATDFADLVNEPAVWSILGLAQLGSSSETCVEDAVESFIKAKDPQYYNAVIHKAQMNKSFLPLIKFLQMAKTTITDSVIETELLYSFARVDNLAQIETIVSSKTSADVQGVGDRCYDEKLFKAAQILYSSIPNYARLASTLVRLEDFQGAFDAAKKANSTTTWKEVCLSCVDAENFQLAHRSGLNIVVLANELDEILNYYQQRGHVTHLIKLIHASTSLDNAHNGLYTQLGILYSNYDPSKLLDFIKASYGKITIPLLLKQCTTNHQWKAVSQLYYFDHEYDDTVATMMNHSNASWDHEQFQEIISKASSEKIYQSVTFYLKHHPDKLVSILSVLSARVDHTRIVSMIRDAKQLPLIKPYLGQTQELDISAVNQAMNDLLIDEEDYDGLRNSIDMYTNFNSLELAKTLESHELVEFQRIAAILYSRNKRFDNAVKISKANKLYKDAMVTAAQSQDPQLVSSLLKYFVEEIKSPQCFSACLIQCYDFVQSDVVFELAWRNKLMNEAMPYFIQLMKEYMEKVDETASIAAKNAKAIAKGGAILTTDTGESEEGTEDQSVDATTTQAAFFGNEPQTVGVQLTGAGVTPAGAYAPVGVGGITGGVPVAITGQVLNPALIQQALTGQIQFR